MDINFNKNEDHNKLLLSELKQKLATVKLGGGEKRIAKLHAEGKMTARERIDYLLDKDGKWATFAASNVSWSLMTLQ
jgi:3-methylcrotonyl-CoA carboxylase beta subunit